MSEKGDPGWEHGQRLPNVKGGSICNYCGHVMKSGGVTRLKYHLSGTEQGKNVKVCTLVPPEVKNAMKTLLESKAAGKAKKTAKMEEIRKELRANIFGKKAYNLEDEDESEEDDGDDTTIYPPDIERHERRAYKQAYRRSRADEWEREQCAKFTGPGGSSRQRLDRSRSVRQPEDRVPLTSSLYKSEKAKQKNVLDMFKGGKIKEGMGRLISRFFIYDNVPANKASSHHFKNMIVGAQKAGMGIDSPTPYEIRTKYLDMEVKEMREYVDSLKPKWKLYGCTLMCDGWTGPTKLSIINFMVYCKGSTVFLKSIDASDKIKDHQYIYGLMKKAVEEVGKTNVVQVVTDNGSAFVKAGKKLMKEYDLFWTPCAAHCIDLIFEDIGKRESVRNVIASGRSITNFIYNHLWLLSQMRTFCKGDIVRPGATRFATNYIALNSLLKKKVGLKALFTSDEWASNPLSRTNMGKQIETIVLTHTFWDQVTQVCNMYEPLYRVLRIVDSEVWPTMSCMYESFKLMKEAIRNNCRSFNWTLTIINNRWDKTLEHPLHAAGIKFH